MDPLKARQLETGHPSAGCLEARLLDAGLLEATDERKSASNQGLNLPEASPFDDL